MSETVGVGRRIREKRILKVMESREKRKVETPRLPRTAKKVRAGKMETEMAELGVTVDTADTEVGVTGDDTLFVHITQQ